MSDENQPRPPTKHQHRQKIWEHMMKNDLVNFPSMVYKRIPNFKGAEDAAKRLSQLEHFQQAKVVKINPDKPQEHVRLFALKEGKEILVPIPRFKTGLFYHVTPPAPGTSDDNVKALATRNGLEKHGQVLGTDLNVKVDLVVLGAVCVSRDGYRIGKGEGFADLEYAMMMRMGAVTQETIVVTTVHDCQIVDTLEAGLFEKHDVPVDIIITPTQTVIVNERLKKPDGIFWDILTPRRVNSISILQQFKKIDESEGKEIVLKLHNDTKSKTSDNKNRGYRVRVRKNPKPEGNSESNLNPETETEANLEKTKSRSNRRPTSGRRMRKIEASKENPNDSFANVQKNDENVEKPKEKMPRRKPTKRKSRPDIDFSLKLSNIGANVRVRDLKTALTKRGVRPTDITWRGPRGFCFLHFGKLRNKDSGPNEPIPVDSIVASLQEFRIDSDVATNEDNYIIVEPAKAITRFEIIDMTAV